MSISSLSFLNSYMIDRKTVNSNETILKEKNTKDYILMKEVIIDSKEEFHRMVENLEAQKYLHNQYLLSLVDYRTEGDTDYEGRTSHKLITFHQYSSHNLRQELFTRI